MRFSTGKNGFLKIPVGCLIAFATALVSFPGIGNANDGLTSDAIIHKAGLTVDWFTHTGVGVGGKLVDWQLSVNENKATTFFTIKAGRYQEKFSQNTLNAFGEPFGVDGAREYANVRTDVLKAEFENDGVKDVEIKVIEYTLPETTIYTLTSNAVVNAIDGDSGKIKWSARIGDPSLPSIGIGSNLSYVAAINGSTLYCLDSKNGKILWSKKCQNPPSASPTVAPEDIYVPLISGRLEVFDLNQEDGEIPFALVSKGRVTARPLTTERTVAWPTSTGVMSVAALYGRKRGVAYQLHSDDAIVNPPAYKDGTFYVGSLDGFIYAVDEERGNVKWQVSTGHAISHAPITMGDYVYVIDQGHELYKIDVRTGWDAKGWEEPRTNIDRFLGAGKENLYLLNRFGKLVVMNQETGALLSTVDIGVVTNILPNFESDRMYMVSDQGMIHCLREITSPIPHFHSNEFVVPVELDPSAPRSKTDDADQKKQADADLDDPFGGGGKKAPKVVVPGSDADDPFGGVKPDPDNPDPDNPFGGVKPKEDTGAGDQGNPFGGDDQGGSDTSGDDDDPFK